jgi:hypothetical protein
MTEKEKVCIIGTQRSGSNLLRLMLNQSPEIAAPHPPHILQTFIPLLPLYGDLADPVRFWRLAADLCEWVRQNPVPWENLRPEPDQIISLCKQANIFCLFDSIYSLYADGKGATVWCCKSMANVRFMDSLTSAYPKMKFVHLFRDGRDVALSFRRAVVGEKHFYFIAKQWREDQRLALEWGSMPGFKRRFHSLRYESLLDHPEEELKRLSDFLGISYTPGMLRYYESEESKRTAAAGVMWANVARPLLEGNHHKFLREATESDVRIFEAVAGDMLERLGYERLMPVEMLPELTEPEIETFREINERLKKVAWDRQTPEERTRREAQQKILKRVREGVK